MGKKNTVLLVVPRSSSAWEGSEAMWVTIAGWASAAEKKFGKAYVLTTDRVASPLEVYDYPLNTKVNQLKPIEKSRWKSLVPIWLKTLAKDFIFWKSLHSSRAYQCKFPWKEEELVFVWEHHDIFPGIGAKLAKAAGVPFVKYVHAPQIWEANKWGVRRPVWGRFLERFFEIPSLRQAYRLLCVSGDVKSKLISMGVKTDQVQTSPMAADPFFFNLFKEKEIDPNLKNNKKVVVGWIGSFRRFHGLETVIRGIEKVIKRNPNVELWLIGDGLEKSFIQELSSKLGMAESVIFFGRKKFKEIPFWIDQFDIALVSAESKSDFHYSPLKLREYLISKKATIAPDAGEIPTLFENGKHLVLYEPGNPEDLANKIEILVHNPSLRARLEQEGQEYALENCTWNFELECLMRNLDLPLHSI